MNYKSNVNINEIGMHGYFYIKTDILMGCSILQDVERL